jgi:peptidoglycan hydrolase-like protein with peptidoglycan-binding domain
MRWLDIPNATASSADAASDSKLIAREPMMAAAVRQLQSKLEVLGFDPGVIDGIRGGRTLDALNHYRETKHLPRVSQIEYDTVAGLLD